MYTRHDVPIDQPAHEVRREMLGEPERWLPASVGSPLGERRYLVRVGFKALAGRITKEVELTVGTPEAPGDWLVVPIAWRATGRDRLFPVLDGKLTVQPLGPHSSILWMGATYQPPLGGLGHELDDVALHNVASATIEDFVEGVAARLAKLAASQPG
ncbi:MAG TPA: hypothetical protein VE953_27800 [Terriglobales bacterium]|nr:hypothetical protein [Terriglobales bacterium]